MELEQALDIINQVLLSKTNRTLNPVERAILRGAWLGETYDRIAEATNYSASYLSRTVSPQLWKLLSDVLGMSISKKNLALCLVQYDTRRGQGSQDVPPEAIAPAPLPEPFPAPPLPISPIGVLSETPFPETPFPDLYIDWGEAVDVSTFYSRQHELDTLLQWIEHDRCRLVSLLGMGGIGKTSLSVKLAHECRNRSTNRSTNPPPAGKVPFRFILWRSLRNAPPLEELLTDLTQGFALQRGGELPTSKERQLSYLIDCLRRDRSLLVLDNVESILQGNRSAGKYREGYEDYGDLLQRVGELSHQSCLVITSREKPETIAMLEGDTLAVRTLTVSGLDLSGAVPILHSKGLSGSAHDECQLVHRCSGNPLALKIVATSIRDLFEGDVSEFLREGTVVFNGLRSLLHQQFDRLSELEQRVMYWLAINREWTSLSDLQTDVVPPVARSRLLEVMESLGRRSLIEVKSGQFTLQPVVMEYVTAEIIEQACAEIVAESPELLLTHALIKAQAKDYIRESQIRLILHPLIHELQVQVPSPLTLTRAIQRILDGLRDRNRLTGTTGPSLVDYGAGNLLNLLHHLNANLSLYNFSYLSIRQAYLRDMTLHRVNFTGSNICNTAFVEPLGAIQSVCFNTDGSLMVAADMGGGIYLWQTATQQRIHTLDGHNYYITTLAFHPTQSILASGSLDATMKLWDVRTGQCLWAWQTPSAVWGITFDATGSWLISSHSDQTIRLWDLTTHGCVRTLEGHQAPVRAVCVNRAGTLLASGSYDQTVKLWDLTTGNCVETLCHHTDVIWGVVFNSTGTELAISSFDATVSIWDIHTHPTTHTFVAARLRHRMTQHTAPIRGIDYSPDGKTVVTAGFDHTLRVWDSQTGQCLKVLSGHHSHVDSVAVSPNGRMILSGSDDASVKLWDLPSGQCIATLQGHTIAFRALAFHPHGTLLISTSDDYHIRLWDHSGRNIKDFQGHSTHSWSVVFHPHEPLFASCCLDGQIKLWDAVSGRCIKTIQAHHNLLLAIAFDPTGTYLISGSFDQTIKLWNWHTQDCVRTFAAPDEGDPNRNHQIYAIAPHPHRPILASGSSDATILLWDRETGKAYCRLEGHTGTIWDLAFHPQGHLLASGSEDYRVHLWDVETGNRWMTLTDHTGPIMGLAFNPDGRLLATGSSDRTIRLWDVATGTCIRVLTGHTHAVRAVAFQPASPDPLAPPILATASQDETIRFWNIHTGECVQLLRPTRLYEGMNITQTTGLTEAQRATLMQLGAIQHEP